MSKETAALHTKLRKALPLLLQHIEDKGGIVGLYDTERTFGTELIKFAMLVHKDITLALLKDDVRAPEGIKVLVTKTWNRKKPTWL